MQQDLTDTLATLDKIDRVKEETVQLRQKVAEAPEKMRQATAALTALSDVDNDEETRKILKYAFVAPAGNSRCPGAGRFAERTKRSGVL